MYWYEDPGKKSYDISLSIEIFEVHIQSYNYYKIIISNTIFFTQYADFKAYIRLQSGGDPLHFFLRRHCLSESPLDNSYPSLHIYLAIEPGECPSI